MAMKRVGQLAAASVALVALATGSAVLIGSARGVREDSPAKAEWPKGAAVEVPKTASAPVVSDARLDVLRKLRDEMYRRYRAGEIGLEAYLKWQQRYRDAILSRTNAPHERLRVAEVELKGLTSLERFVKRQQELGQVSRTDALMATYYRLEAEERLEQAKQGLANSEPQNAPAEHPRKKPGSP